jgi:ATP-binding cassette subfamily F protein 3
MTEGLTEGLGEKSFVPKREEEIEKEIDPKLKAALDLHVFDILPDKVGNRELIGGLSNSLVGAANCEIQRTHPPIKIDQLKLESGKSVAMIGPNGVGKSTVLDAIMQRHNADFDARSGAGARVYGRSFHERERLRIARLDQEEILERISHMNVREVINQSTEYFKEQFPLDWEDVDAYDRNMANTEAQQRIEELASRMIKLFDMEEFLKRSVSELSGGERTKLVLLMNLASEPDVLLLDEPTNHLDMESIAKLVGIFEKYKKAGTSIVSVSHVDWFLEEAGNDGVVEIKTEKGKREVVTSKSPYRNYAKSREGMEVITEPISWEKSPARKTNQTVISTAETINVADSPVKNAKFPSIQSGEVVILSGRNGTGKSRIMEAIAGKSAKEKNFTKEKGVQLAYMPQFWPDEVASGNLEEFFHWVRNGVNPWCEVTSKQYVAFLRKTGFGVSQKGVRIDESLLKRPINSFSGGEQRLLWFLATSSLPNIDVLLLDEPTNHMDRKLQKIITRAIQDFPGAVVLASHDVRLIESLTSDVGNKSVITPKHLVLNKEEGGTQIEVSNEAPSDYALRVRGEALQKAKRFKI